MTNTPQNPYAKAAGAYGNHAQKHETSQRELEARVLLKSARMLKELQDNWDEVTTEMLDHALKYNRQIWMMFYDTALENEDESRPNDLRSNIVNLANFIFKREGDILASRERTPDKLDVLININKEIAAGLMGNTKQIPE
ncbi:MAG: flagellar biosynthesis regulator FlaF [Alphaproteobacteria bacterium]